MQNYFGDEEDTDEMFCPEYIFVPQDKIELKPDDSKHGMLIYNIFIDKMSKKRKTTLTFIEELKEDEDADEDDDSDDQLLINRESHL